MRCHRKISGLLGGRLAGSGTCLALAAFLVHFLFPLAYFHHLAAKSPRSIGLQQGESRTGSGFLSRHHRHRASPHDPASCPVCQASSSFEDHAALPSLPAPGCLWLALLPLFPDFTPHFAILGRLVSPPRAPPLQPLKLAA